MQFATQAFSWKLQAFIRHQISKGVTPDRFWQCKYHLDWVTDSQGLLPHGLPQDLSCQAKKATVV